MNPQILASSIYVYNYLTNIFVRANAEELTDGPVCWAYDSVFEQVCVINSTVGAEQLGSIAEEITSRYARKKRIITTHSPNDIEKILPEFGLFASKILFFYRKRRKANNADVVSEPIFDLQLIARNNDSSGSGRGPVDPAKTFQCVGGVCDRMPVEANDDNRTCRYHKSSSRV
jgi:hypothetical protein